MANSITADEIREQFSQAMSAMYQQEVPQYGTLLELVAGCAGKQSSTARKNGKCRRAGATEC